MSLLDVIGRVFLFSNNPKRLAEWYRESLGSNYDETLDLPIGASPGQFI